MKRVYKVEVETTAPPSKLDRLDGRVAQVLELVLDQVEVFVEEDDDFVPVKAMDLC